MMKRQLLWTRVGLALTLTLLLGLAVLSAGAAAAPVATEVLLSGESTQISAAFSTTLEGNVPDDDDGGSCLDVEKYVDKGAAQTGDTLTYTILLTNGRYPCGDDDDIVAAQGVAASLAPSDDDDDGCCYCRTIQIDDEIPAHTTYVQGSATGGNARFSHDGGYTYDTSDAAPVTHIRWIFDNLSPEQSVEMSFQVQIDAGTPQGTEICNTACGEGSDCSYGGDDDDLISSCNATGSSLSSDDDLGDRHDCDTVCTQVVGEPSGDVCYAVADNDNVSGSPDRLMTFDIQTAFVSLIGSTGTEHIEAIAFRPGTDVLYAADTNRLGTLNLLNGAYTPAASTFGSGGGAAGSITFSDVDGLTFDLTTGVLYGTHRRSGSSKDVLFQIDPATGAHIPNAFGSGVDYVAINGSGVLDDVDDIASDPVTGQMYGASNNGGAGGVLLIIDKYTGSSSVVGSFGVDDIEGIAFYNDGQLYGSTGNYTTGPSTNNRLYRINKATAVATEVGPFGSQRDYEGLACLTGGASIVLSKQADRTSAAVGDTIHYTYEVVNTGGELLDPVTLVDDMLGPIALADTSLEPGESTTGTATYSVQMDDAPGSIVNEATVTGVPPQGDPVTDTDTAEVDVFFPLELVTDKTAVAEECENATVQLIVGGAGTPGEDRVPLDVMLVLDRSGSMDNYGTSGEPQPISDVQDAAKLLIDELDSAFDRVGLVTYANTASLDHVLSSNFASVKAEINDISVGGWTNIGDAIYDAQAHLGTNARPEAIPVMVLLTDGVPTDRHPNIHCQDWPTSPNACTQDVLNQAAAAKSAGTTIYTIGIFQYMQGDHPQSAALARDIMEEAASSPDAFYDAPDISDLSGIFEEIANIITNIAGRDVVVTDILPPEVHYASGSASPLPVSVSGQTLTWEFAEIGVTETVTITFDVILDPPRANQLVDVYPDSRVDYINFQGNLASAPFPETRVTPQQCPSIGDYVWYDADADGLQDVEEGDKGIGNVTLALYDSGDNLVTTTTSDADGGYIFDFIPPGAYYVDVTDDFGILTGLIHTLGPESQPDPTGLITVGLGDTYRDADFGYVDEPEFGKAIIGDTVWYDGDGDGWQDPGEPGIPGQQVCASDGVNSYCDTTDNNGIYLIEVPAGTYQVSPTSPPSGLIATTPETQTAAVAAGEQFLDADFGYKGGATPLGSIGDQIWHDTTPDGVYVAGSETGIPGVSVDLIADENGNGTWDAGEPIIATATSDSFGQYLFQGLPAGDYLVLVSDTQNVLEDYAPTVPGSNAGQNNNNQAQPYAVSLSPGGSELTADFGYVENGPPGELGIIGNQVWYEEDGNGLYNPESGDVGIAGVTVALHKDGNLYAVTTTGASGDYVFTSLPAGNYSVQVTDDFGVLDGYVLTVLGPHPWRVTTTTKPSPTPSHCLMGA